MSKDLTKPLKEKPQVIDDNNNKINNEKNDNNIIIENNLNDNEMNSLDFNNALVIDKRTYVQYYFSLLRTKHLLIFSFFPSNDYNSLIIKINLFLFNFSLYYIINGFFFTDSTMHKIYEDKGSFDFIYQLPQIIYSSIISALIDKVIKYFSLTEELALELKKEKADVNIFYKYTKTIRCLIIKFILFFFLAIIFLILFWYYISCFCAIYKNTQKHLIKDTLITFGLSMLYPFYLCLLPGLWRIPALRAEQKDKKLIYKLGTIIEKLI